VAKAALKRFHYVKPAEEPAVTAPTDTTTAPVTEAAAPTSASTPALGSTVDILV
jgi:hypothetical protein